MAAYADGCKVSAAVDRDGYIVADQTKAQNEDMLINHVLSIIGGTIALLKLFSARCIPTITPSFYLRNGATVIGALNTIKVIIDDAKASKKKLEAHIGDTNNPDIEKLNEQIAALEEAQSHNGCLSNC